MTEAQLYGIGKGGAQVFNTSDIANQYVQHVQNANLKRQKENESLAEEISKLDSKGVRPQDRDDMFAKYDQIKSVFHDYELSRDHRQRLDLKLQMDGLKADFLSFIEKSKAYGDKFKQLGTLALNDKDGDLDEKWVGKYHAASSLAMSDPKFNDLTKSLDSTPWKARQLDVKTYENDIVNRSLNEIKKQKIVGKGENARYYNIDGREIDQSKLLSSVYRDLGSKDGPVLARYIQSQYGVRGDGNADPEDIEAFVNDIMARNSGRFAVSERAAGFVNRQDSQRTGSNAKKQATYRQNWANDMLDGKPGSGEELKSIVESSGRYNGKLGIQTKGNKIIFNVPTSSYLDENMNIKVKNGYVVEVDKANRKDAAIKINQMLNDITKENVSHSTLMTEGGSKKVSNGKGAKNLTSQPKPATKKKSLPTNFWGK